MFVAGLIAITAVLVVRASWFGFFTMVGGSYTLRLPRLRMQLASGAAIALIGAISQTEDSQAPLPMHLTLFAAALVIDLLLVWSIVWLLREREQQVTRHRESLAELSEVNRRLEATIAENEGLHRQLLVQAREAGVVDERRRMAREIHDTLAQGLTGIVTQLQAAEQAASRTAGEAAGWRRHVAAATQLARESLTEARRSVEALRPEPLDGCRLSEALAGVAERWSSLNRIPAQVTTTGTARPVDPEAEFALLRAAQEALANVARHAHATRVGLTISYMENEVALGRAGRRGRLRPGAARRRVRPGRDAAADRGAVRHAAGRVRAGRRNGDFRLRADRAEPGPLVSGPGEPPIRLLIADDHPVVRDGLSGMFAADPDFTVVGEAGDGSQALRLADAARPDVILMDLRMPGMDGVTAIAELTRRGNPARVLVLTTYDTDSYVLPAIEAGATGYLLKDAPRDELLRAVRAAAAGQSVLAPSVATRLMNRMRVTGARGAQPARTRGARRWSRRGSTNREAAARLFISEATVKTHLLHIYAKLGVTDRAAAVAEAFNRGLLGTSREP